MFLSSLLQAWMPLSLPESQPTPQCLCDEIRVLLPQTRLPSLRTLSTICIYYFICVMFSCHVHSPDPSAQDRKALREPQTRENRRKKKQLNASLSVEGDLLLPLLGRGEGPGVGILQAWRQTPAWRLGCWWMGVHRTRNTYRLGQRRGCLGQRWLHRGRGGWALVLLCHKPFNPLFFPGPFATPLEKTFNSFYGLFTSYFEITGLYVCSLIFLFQALPSDFYYRS